MASARPSCREVSRIRPTATRQLAIQKNGTWYSAPARLASQGSRSQVCSRLGVWLLKPHPAYGWDLTKNICETYRTDARIDLAYTYTPYGEVSPAHAYDQPLRWSSEYHDTESPRRLGGGLDKHEVFAPKGRAPKGVGASQLGLVYYNYRHYNPVMGRWMGRDFVQISRHKNIYLNILNSPQKNIDLLVLMFSDINIATAKVNLEWWDDDGGPAGHNGSLDIGQQDKLLSAIEAQNSAICTCGKIVKTEASYTNRDRNGVVISSFWWGKSTPQELHYRASSSRVYQRGNEHYIPLSSFKLSPAP